MQVGKECIEYIAFLLIRLTAPFSLLDFTNLAILCVAFILFSLFKLIYFCPCTSCLMHVCKAFKMYKEWEAKLFLFVILIGLDPSSWSCLPLWCTKVTPTCKSTVISALWPVTCLNKKFCRKKSDRSPKKKDFQNNMFILHLHHRFKADSVGLHKLMSLAKGGKGFLLKGMRNLFPELGCQACL